MMAGGAAGKVAPSGNRSAVVVPDVQCIGGDSEGQGERTAELPLASGMQCFEQWPRVAVRFVEEGTWLEWRMMLPVPRKQNKPMGWENVRGVLSIAAAPKAFAKVICACVRGAGRRPKRRVQLCSFVDLKKALLRTIAMRHSC